MPIALVGLVPTLASAATNKADVFVGVSGPSSAYVGQTMSYEISYGNTGPDVATGVVITDTTSGGASSSYFDFDAFDAPEFSISCAALS